MRLLSVRRNRGFTLIELLVALTVMGVLAVKALPAMADYVLNAKLREGANSVVTMATFARNEAVKRNLSLSLKSDGSTLTVLQQEGTTTTTLRSVVLVSPARTESFTAIFDSAGRLAPFGSQLRTQVTGASPFDCGQDIRCPGLLIEAGGGVSLCKEGVCP